jgi:hypothetical protein
MFLKRWSAALPGSEEEFSQIHRIERCIDFTGVLRLGDAGGKWNAPFLEDRLQPVAQEFALRAGLKAEITNQAPAIPFIAFQFSADDVQKPLQPLPGGKRLVVQSLTDKLFGVGEKTVEYFLSKRFLGTEMISEGTVRSPGGCADIAYRSPLVSRAEHHLQAGIENVFAKGWSAHEDNNTYVRIKCQRTLHAWT